MKSYTPEQRQAYVDGYRSSDKSQRQYCRDVDLNYHTLQHWLHHGTTNKRRKPHGFVELRTDTASLPAPQAAAVKLTVGSITFESPQWPTASFVAELARELS